MNRRRLLIGSGAVAALWALPTVADNYLESDPQPHTSDPATPAPDIEVSTDDVRDVMARPWQYEDALVQFVGVIVEIRVAPPDQGYPVGEDPEDQVPFRTQILVSAEHDDGNSELFLVALDHDPVGIHKDHRVRVVASFVGTHRELFDDGLTFWDWPLFVAVSVELEPETDDDP